MPPQCSECAGRVPTGRTVTCSTACAKARQGRQLADRSAARSAAAKRNLKRRCEAPLCGREFTAEHGNIRYCSDPCRVAGLAAAVERQRGRRQAQRKEKPNGVFTETVESGAMQPGSNPEALPPSSREGTAQAPS